MEPPSLRIARLARRQHGVIHRDRLKAYGLSSSAISRWTESGRLHRIHPCVYAVGHDRLSLEGRALAAVLAVGPRAVVSGRCAAHLWRTLRGEVTHIDVLTPVRCKLHLEGVRVHYTRELPRQDVSRRSGVPVLRIHRLVVELAEEMTAEQLANVIHEASYRRLLDLSAVEQAARRWRNKTGAARVKRALGLHVGGSRGTLSDLEDAFLHLLREAGLPEPVINRTFTGRGGGMLLDCFWPEFDLCVEIDGRPHQLLRGRRRDRRRDLGLAEEGITIIRVIPSEFATGVEAVRLHLAAHVVERTVGVGAR